MRILIVEDDELNQEVIKELVKLLYPEIDIELANNGKEALEKLQNFDFNLILSDIDIPEVNGIDLMKMIKEKKKSLPVIAFTAFAVVGDRERLLLEGFDDYISKPVELEELKRVLDKYLKGG